MKNKNHDRNLSSAEIESLSVQERKIQEQIKKLQDYVEHGPEQELAAEKERFSTLPAPSEVKSKQREQQFMEKLSRGELKNERRHQTKSGLLLIFLILAITFIILWIYTIISS